MSYPLDSYIDTCFRSLRPEEKKALLEKEQITKYQVVKGSYLWNYLEELYNSGTYPRPLMAIAVFRSHFLQLLRIC